MAQETLFAILARQPWWVTLLVAFALFALVHAIFPPIAPFMAAPFVALSLYIAYRQARGGSPTHAAERLQALREMSWEEFSTTLSNAYRRDGYAVAPADAPGYELRLTKGGRVTYVQCRRWKVNQVGVAPVRELARAIENGDASHGICIAAGGFSEPARKFAAGEPVTLLSGVELVQLVGRVPKKKKADARS